MIHIVGGNLKKPYQVRIGPLEQWFRSDHPITLSSGKVSVWGDRSGKGRDLTFDNAAYYPSYITDGLNGHPLVGDGVNYQYLFNTSLTGLTNLPKCTAIGVMQNCCAEAGGIFDWKGDARLGWQPWAGTFYLYVGNGSGTFAFTTNDPVIMVTTFDGSLANNQKVKMYVNGELKTTGIAPSTTALSFTQSIFNAVDNTANHVQGAEFLLYSDVFSDENLTSFTQYLANYYGITLP